MLFRFPAIYHGKNMRRLIICDLSGCTKFYTLSHNRYDFRVRLTYDNMCVLIFSKSFVWIMSHSKNNRVTYHHGILVFMSIPGFHVRFYLFLTFLDLFSINSEHQISWNLFIGSRVFSCGRTDRHDESNCLFRNFANAPKTHFKLQAIHMFGFY
jgi:hypothetical protein